MSTNQNALKQVNRSGFPFQLKVEDDIRSTEAKHHWSVAGREHAWHDSEGNNGFIDLVLKHKEFSTYRLIIECKRVKADDATQLQWLFLVEEARADSVVRASSFQVEADIEVRVWDDVRVMPASLESEFCVLKGDEPRRASLLESLAKGLLDSTEGLAQEEVNMAESIRNSEQNPRGLYVRLFLFPMIITNAKIAVCRFNPSRVKLDHGMLEPDDAEIFEVPMIRFRKSLATDFPEGVFYTLDGANKARERTVLVVNAEHLTDILQKWQMGTMPDRPYAIERLARKTRDQ
jgi:hypothetical protein